MFEAAFYVTAALAAAYILISSIWRGLVEGEHGLPVARVERPARFWLEVSAGMVILAAFVVLAYLKATEL
jgi:hypothetical protein